MSPDWTEALRRETSEVSRFCHELSDAQWRTPSRCTGWRVQDVVAHMGGGMHSLFTPSSVKLLVSKDIERTNDEFVRARDGWRPADVLAEFDRWRGRCVRMAGMVTRTPLARVPVPLGELGSFPTALLLGGALTFDQHTHLRHDIAPALGRTAPATDEVRMTCVLAWMFAVLSNQLKAANPRWLTRPLAVTLDGPGGGTWRVSADGDITEGPGSDAAARITAKSLDFPLWGTCRAPWRDHEVSISGDEEYGARFLDSVNVV